MTKLTQEEQQLARDQLGKTPAKFSARNFRITKEVRASPEFEWFLAVMAVVKISNPDIDVDAHLDEIDRRVEAAGGLEMAATMAEAEYAGKKH